VQALNSADRDAQAALLTWQVVRQARHNPIGKIQAAIEPPALEPGRG